MLRSLNEIDQTARKAAHGCGLAWGVADEVGKAIRWLHLFGLDGVAGLLAVLDQYNHRIVADYAPQSLRGIWRARKGILSPLLTGVSLCDCLGDGLGNYLGMLRHQPVETEKIAHPLLTAGFLGHYLLGQAEHQEQSIQLTWSNVSLEFHRNKLAVSGNKKDLETKISNQLVCKRVPNSNSTFIAPVIGDVAVNDSLWKKLEQYALNTCVAATEASRLSGAGAGLNDND